ncbi:MAG: GUN4 domain-containing protein [Microcoleus anatoxicus]|uniref:GUN4 domain-containing protein n=1 Tax=Microcoleus anatoxicus TaxID=2705319 RepID=UPI0036704EBA
MIWNFAQGIITAVNGILGPQTVMAMTQRQNEIDRIASQIEMQNRSLEFQALMEGVRQEHSKEMEAYRQYCEDVRLQKRLDSEREQLARRFQHEEKLEQYRRETHLILSRAQLLTALTLADDKEIRESFPLKTPARVILDAYKSYQDNMKQIPLLVVISPPALQFEKFPHVAQGFGLVENRLIDEIQEFCKHYSLNNQERPVRYQGADWESKYSHGKTGIDTLHHVLKSVPTVVLESKFDGDLLRVYVAGWDMMQEVPHYEKVLTIPWKEVLYPIARKYAEEWREYRMKLLEKGRSLEELKRRGGDNELNLLILEEEEEDRELGRGGQHDYQYNVKEDKYIQELAQFLGICHCILVGLMADRYHFYHGDVRPKLPELLPGLLEKMPSNSLNEMLVGEIVSSYQSLYQSIEGKRPNAIPYLLLDLALSLSGLSDKSWAKKQVEFSIKAWLKLRNGVSEEKLSLLNLENLLEVFKSTLTVADSEYAEKLTGCLAAIGESRYREMIGEVIKRQQENEQYSQDNSVSSNVDYTNLRDLLAAKKWKEADQETEKVMERVILKIAMGLEEEKWLDEEETRHITEHITEYIEKFPCEDLRTIDQLWVKYSNGHFGFSVQKRIYQSLGGTSEYDGEVWERFGNRVGWRQNNKWLYYNELNFSTKAPKAHLPVGESGGGIEENRERLRFENGVVVERIVEKTGRVVSGVSLFEMFASRLVDCNI